MEPIKVISSSVLAVVLTIPAEAPLWGHRWPNPAADGEQHLNPRVLHGGGDVPLERITA